MVINVVFFPDLFYSYSLYKYIFPTIAATTVRDNFATMVAEEKLYIAMVGKFSYNGGTGGIIYSDGIVLLQYIKLNVNKVGSMTETPLI